MGGNGISNRKGLIIALVALVVVIAVASIAYNRLSADAGSQGVASGTGGSDTATAQTDDQGTTGSSSTGTSDTSSSSASSSSAATVLPNTPGERKAAEDVTFMDADGTAHTLSSYKGKPVMIVFWASWCHYCKQELDTLGGIVPSYGDSIEIIPIDCVSGTKETRADGEAYVQSAGITYPVYFDEADTRAAAVYGASTIPMTVFIDADGDFVGYHAGVMTEQQITAVLDALIAEGNM